MSSSHPDSQRPKDATEAIKGLLSDITSTTETMSKTFEDTILRHEEQFIKTYRLKMSELTGLYD